MMIDKGESYPAKSVEIMELAVSATYSAFKGNYDEAVEKMKSATALEEGMSPPSGPPDLRQLLRPESPDRGVRSRIE